eukprot:PhM_4_TR13281/c0_g1_i1/m.36332
MFRFSLSLFRPSFLTTARTIVDRQQAYERSTSSHTAEDNLRAVALSPAVITRDCPQHLRALITLGFVAPTTTTTMQHNKQMDNNNAITRTPRFFQLRPTVEPVLQRLRTKKPSDLFIVDYANIGGHSDEVVQEYFSDFVAAKKKKQSLPSSSMSGPALLVIDEAQTAPSARTYNESSSSVITDETTSCNEDIVRVKVLPGQDTGDLWGVLFASVLLAHSPDSTIHLLTVDRDYMDSMVALFPQKGRVVVHRDVVIRSTHERTRRNNRKVASEQSSQSPAASKHYLRVSTTTTVVPTHFWEEAFRRFGVPDADACLDSLLSVSTNEREAEEIESFHFVVESFAADAAASASAATCAAVHCIIFDESSLTHSLGAASDRSLPERKELCALLSQFPDNAAVFILLLAKDDTTAAATAESHLALGPGVRRATIPTVLPGSGVDPRAYMCSRIRHKSQSHPTVRIILHDGQAVLPVPGGWNIFVTSQAFTLLRGFAFPVCLQQRLRNDKQLGVRNNNGKLPKRFMFCRGAGKEKKGKPTPNKLICVIAYESSSNDGGNTDGCEGNTAVAKTTTTTNESFSAASLRLHEACFAKVCQYDLTYDASTTVGDAPTVSIALLGDRRLYSDIELNRFVESMEGFLSTMTTTESADRRLAKFVVSVDVF